MLREIQQVLRSIMLLAKQRQQHGLKCAGGLLVLLWTETGTSVESLNCTVATAGPWCTGIKMEALQPVLTDLKQTRFHCVRLCPHPDPEELCAFTDLYGSLRLLLSFQMKDATLFSPESCAHIEAFFHRFSLANAGIKIHLKFKFSQQTIQREFRMKIKSKVAWANQPSLILDVTCHTHNVPVTGRSTFLQNLLAQLDCQELGLHGLHCSSSEDLVHSGGTVYTVEQENLEDPEQESSLPSVQQSLLLFLFLQHSDPFTCQLSDIMATEVLIEHHLEDILNNNRQAVTSALQTELKNTLKSQTRRKKDQEKLRLAAEVILSSSISIVSCSSNLDFRNACLNSMKVGDTHDLSASLRESLRRVTSWKFIPRSRCYSAQMEEHPESDEPNRTEI